MSEKLAEVYEQYDMEILSSKKGRGATILNTTKGMRILEPFRGNITRLEQEYILKKTFVEHGCNYLDAFIKNREDQLLTYDKYRQPYVLKVHFEGEECDMHGKEDIARGIRLLAKFHIQGQKLLPEFNRAWQLYLEEKEQTRIEEIRQAIENGEELEKLASLYEISAEALEKLLGQGEVTGKKESEQLQHKISLEGDVSQQSEGVENLFFRHNQEIKKILKYINRVKRKNEFETTFLKVYQQFYETGVQCYHMIKNMHFQENAGQLHSKNPHYGICHGSFNQHNVILGEKLDAIIHFERFTKGNQLNDLYQFSRKVMEKNAFDFSLLEEIFQSYEEWIPLQEDDYRYIYILFSYPEKFWKIANGYYNTNKAFLSPKYLEKLETVILQEQAKQKLLDDFKAKKLLFN